MAKKQAETQQSFGHSVTGPVTSGVECLGMHFKSDDERRAFFSEKLKEKLQDPGFRKIDGFPIASDDDILRLSDPPYYTACPNPFIEEFIRHYGRSYESKLLYRREPFATDVSEGKTDPIYNAHAYHTKVPYKAIMRYILHYTEPGDIVLDGFCGTGMAGIAAQLCANRTEISELGYQVDKDGLVRERGQDAGGTITSVPVSKLGLRRSILNDLSPAATFISANYCTPVESAEFQHAAEELLSQLEVEVGWMYETLHTDGKTKGRITYTVWSDVFSCGQCSKEIVFVHEALDRKTGSIRDTFPCPHCGANSRKDDLTLLYESTHDNALNKMVSLPRRVPVFINYIVQGQKYQKQPDKFDLDLLRKIAHLPLPEVLPRLELPDMQMRHVGRMQPAKISYIHQFFLPRAAQAVGAAWKIAQAWPDRRIRQSLLYFVEQAVWTASLLNRFRPTGYSQVNQYLAGVFYIPSQHSECSPWYMLQGKAARLTKLFREFLPVAGATIVTTQGLAGMSLPADSIDYIFTDPPFGENIYYSDLNILVESWLRVRTAPKSEAIVDRVKGKTLLDYQRMMTECFVKYSQVLKPGRWITVEFHNSRNSVWNAIQEALQDAGFVVADVRTLDKQQGSFQQVVSGNTVKRDLIISAYKPNGGLEQRFKVKAGKEEGAWDFINTHLRQLPVFVVKAGAAEPVVERQSHLLFDRMVAFHVQRGVAVPMSSAEFRAELAQKYAERDGMYFLPDQVTEYDRKRMTVRELLQLELFVSDEASAIEWLKQQLTFKPQTFQDVQPVFMRETRGNWSKHEPALELLTLLEQNYLKYDGTGAVPSQIHSYLSSNFKELRNKSKDDALLRARAADRWYVPDPTKAADIEKLRERALLREFDEYAASSQRTLKVFRLEAVRAGFRRAWQQNDYVRIIEIVEKLPEDVVQEDPMLLMWYTNSLTRSGRES
jgi:DNA modification methylase